MPPRDPTVSVIFYVMASLAQMERELVLERARAGLEVTKKLGRVGAENGA